MQHTPRSDHDLQTDQIDHLYPSYFLPVPLRYLTQDLTGPTQETLATLL